MSWKDQGRALAASWVLVLVLFIVAAVGGYVMSKKGESRYEASARVTLAAAPSVTDPFAQVEAISHVNQGSLLPTLASIYSAAGSGDLVGSVRVPPGFSVSASILQQSNVVDVIVNGPDAARAADVADRLALAGGKQFADVYPIFRVQLVRGARVPTAPVSPSPSRDAAIAGMVGLALGYLLALARYARRRGREAKAAEAVAVVEAPTAAAPEKPTVETEKPDAAPGKEEKKKAVPAPAAVSPDAPDKAPKVGDTSTDNEDLHTVVALNANVISNGKIVSNRKVVQNGKVIANGAAAKIPPPPAGKRPPGGRPAKANRPWTQT